MINNTWLDPIDPSIPKPEYENMPNSRCMPSSDAIWVEIPKEHYRSIQPKETPLYPIDGNPSLVRFGDYK